MTEHRPGVEFDGVFWYHEVRRKEGEGADLLAGAQHSFRFQLRFRFPFSAFGFSFVFVFGFV